MGLVRRNCGIDDWELYTHALGRIGVLDDCFYFVLRRCICRNIWRLLAWETILERFPNWCIAIHSAVPAGLDVPIRPPGFHPGLFSFVPAGL